MKRTLGIGLLVAALPALLAAGCAGTIVKQAYYGATGASARYFEVESLGGPTSLLQYRSVQVQDFDASPMRGAIPTDQTAAVKPAILRQVAELEPLQGGGKPALLIRGRYMDFDSGGPALRAVGFGTDPFLTAQIEIVDADSGKVLGVAMVTGTIKSALRTGSTEMADGVGKAVKGLLAAHMKEPK